MKRKRAKIKELWDEYREAKQVSEGKWWFIEEPYPPKWFIKEELGL